jgi:hypothetical protein
MTRDTGVTFWPAQGSTASRFTIGILLIVAKMAQLQRALAGKLPYRRGQVAAGAIRGKEWTQ